MLMDKISVIVPCYNVEKYLACCLDSILVQTYKNIEVIAIDDGSTDETGKIIDKYAARDGRVIAVHQDNSGLPRVREKGIELSTGDYIGFVDGDDTIEPDMYERLFNNALKYNADISHCGVSFIWQSGHVEKHYGTGKIVEQDKFSGVRDLLVGEQIEPSLCNKIYSKKIIRESCLDFTVLNNEDLLRNFTLFDRAQKSVYEDFCGYNYYQRSGSMSKDDSKIVASFRHIERARKLIVENSDKEIYPYAMRLLLSTYVTFINQNFQKNDSKIKEVCRECREILRNAGDNLHYLIRRQRIAAILAVYVPWLHHFIYKIYSNGR